MIVIPAIDIKGGKSVRLLQGRAEDETVYFDDPIDAAKKWLDAHPDVPIKRDKLADAVSMRDSYKLLIEKLIPEL